MTTWIKANKDYVVTDDGWEIGTLSRKKISEIIRERLTHAKKIGLLKHGIPQAVR